MRCIVYLATIGMVLCACSAADAHDLVTANPELQRPTTLPSSGAETNGARALTGSDARPSALLLDLRTGFALPLGEARTFADGRSAIDIAFGYLAPSGRYAAVTAGFSKLHSTVTDFRESTFQFGVDLAYRPTLPGVVSPWIGLGFAWQILWLSKNDFYMKAIGPEFPIVRLGTDFLLGDQLAVGPFAAFAYRRYDTFSVEGQTPVELRSLSRRDAWLMLGLSASFGSPRR